MAGTLRFRSVGGVAPDDVLDRLRSAAPPAAGALPIRDPGRPLFLGSPDGRRRISGRLPRDPPVLDTAGSHATSGDAHDPGGVRKSRIVRSRLPGRAASNRGRPES
jgi:hypothetical protein